ncbi:copper homeostasis protein CutC [Aquirufa rosea]|uniref:PF03932 family protein CutC n=1 Tax=Aquirufa rosea TaxID=2509241 RepID=A0A4Q1BZQ9_9BACT|nr:copper homeostasis protein CutC [Aquirufa rosea]RXK49611.1 copper homeostasis protein CutC [Aquirufa rosea]
MSDFRPISLEVCSYSLYSCLAADQAGADRVELCASPWEGGTSPSAGVVSEALTLTSLGIHVMVRARGGDFCYDAWEKKTMLAEVNQYLSMGVHGIVVGALNPKGDLDIDFLKEVTYIVGDSAELTCHRAIDVSRQPLEVMEALIELGFTRILTSGQKNKAIEGIDAIANMVEAAQGRIQIMAGSGVNPQNCLQLLDAGVDALHLSARTTRESDMVYRRPGISMGGVAEISEFEVAYASPEIIRAVVSKIKNY